jgi:DNA sulfur modification protein DndD
VFLEEVVIQNVGLFRQRHTLQLAPQSTTKPIILIGGLNGSGKTTLLDSIQLALYGRRARCSNRGALSYEEYLRRCVSNGIKPAEWSSVQVQFRQWTDGHEHVYRIRRSWVKNNGGVAEKVEVFRDNVPDRVLADTWLDFVEELIPVEMSQLFFFDGEKIEEFADLESSTHLLAKAVHSLLGLDVVNRLESDLVALERRKQIALKNDMERAQIREAEAEVNRLNEKLDGLLVQRGTLQNDVDRCQKHQREIAAIYEKRGGPLFEQRQVIENERAQVQKELRDIEEELRAMAAGTAPLLLVRHLISSIAKQNRREEAAGKAVVVKQILTERDEQLLKTVQAQEAPSSLISTISAFLADDRERRTATSEGVDLYLQLDPENKEMLRTLQEAVLPKTLKQITQVLQRTDYLQTALVDFDRKLASIPAEDTLTDILEQRNAAQIAVDEASRKIAELDAEIEKISNQREQTQSRLIAQIEKTVEKRFELEDSERTVSHSQRVRATLINFRASVVERHVKRIAQLVLDSFRRLLRKESLISELKIDSETFALEMRSADGRVLSPDRLSAGERQLLAVSILWGLARASGRPLPVVIDTPLGRLDASHRSTLVKSYFPHASHQVLLLSTDKEIDEHYFNQLKPFIGRTYHLEFDDTQGNSQIKTGYFW